MLFTVYKIRYLIYLSGNLRILIYLQSQTIKKEWICSYAFINRCLKACFTRSLEFCDFAGWSMVWDIILIYSYSSCGGLNLAFLTLNYTCENKSNNIGNPAAVNLMKVSTVIWICLSSFSLLSPIKLTSQLSRPNIWD